jgi:hypothetical protein
MISTRNLSSLQDIQKIKGLMQSLALLDAILEAKPEFRYYSFDNNWGSNTQLGSMKNGSGDEFYLAFMPFGAIIKGFAHESIMNPYSKDPPKVWEGVIEYVPEELLKVVKNPALSPEDITFCIWRTIQDKEWKRGRIEFPEGNDPDGSEELLSILDGNPETYWKWGEYYYERKIDIEGIRGIYYHHPITNEIISILNPKISLKSIQEDVKLIGY